MLGVSFSFNRLSYYSSNPIKVPSNKSDLNRISSHTEIRWWQNSPVCLLLYTQCVHSEKVKSRNTQSIDTLISFVIFACYVQNIRILFFSVNLGHVADASFTVAEIADNLGILKIVIFKLFFLTYPFKLRGIDADYLCELPKLASLKKSLFSVHVFWSIQHPNFPTF